MQNKFKPILFSTEMVQAILENRKTKTRRILNTGIKTMPENTVVHITDNGAMAHFQSKSFNPTNICGVKGKFEIGDILYVRETFQKLELSLHPGVDYLYKADIDLFNPDIIFWSPSIHMPKKAARIFLEVTNVRVERLQDITEEECIAEGILPISNSQDRQYFDYSKPILVPEGLPAFFSFSSLWCSIYGNESWEMNPLVWVYEFEVIEKPEDFGIN